MVKFIFNILNDVKTTADKERCDLSNVRAAYQHARKVIVEIMTEELQEQDSAIHLPVLIEYADHMRVANIKSVTTIVESTNPFVA